MAVGVLIWSRAPFISVGVTGEEGSCLLPWALQELCGGRTCLSDVQSWGFQPKAPQGWSTSGARDTLPLFCKPPSIATQAKVSGEPHFTSFHLRVSHRHVPSNLVILEGLRPDSSRKIYSDSKVTFQVVPLK